MDQSTMNTLYLITSLAITALFPCAIYWLVRREDGFIDDFNERNLGAEAELSPHAQTFMTLNNYKLKLEKEHCNEYRNDW